MYYSTFPCNISHFLLFFPIFIYYSLLPSMIPCFHLLFPISISYSLIPSVIPDSRLSGEQCPGSAVGRGINTLGRAPQSRDGHRDALPAPAKPWGSSRCPIPVKRGRMALPALGTCRAPQLPSTSPKRIIRGYPSPGLWKGTVDAPVDVGGRMPWPWPWHHFGAGDGSSVRLTSATL